VRIVCESIAKTIERGARLLEPNSSRRQVPARRRQLRVAEPVADVVIGDSGCFARARRELSAEIMEVQSADAGRSTGLRPRVLNDRLWLQSSDGSGGSVNRYLSEAELQTLLQTHDLAVTW
jgi:hypothetical protein